MAEPSTKQEVLRVIYIDGIYFSLRCDSIASEVIYVAMGIDEEGYRQILGFHVGGNESAHGWKEFLKELYQRGAIERDPTCLAYLTA